MDMKFKGRVWICGDDIDTDTIIPGRRGTIPTFEEMKKYAFEHLMPEFASLVKEGDIIIAGSNFGCGSSREQAATVLAVNGIKCIIAKSFARIFFRNAFNSGILLIECSGIQDVVSRWDEVTVSVNESVSANGYSFPIGKVPENLFKIVDRGGLIEDTKIRIREGLEPLKVTKLTDEEKRAKGFTLAEKLLRASSGVKDLKAGDIVMAKPDFFLIHDIYTPYVLSTLRRIGADKILDPDKVAIVYDHCMPTAVAANDYFHYDAGLEIAKEYGVKKQHIGEGICHTLMHEKGYAKPGEVAIATDSHTTTYGAVGNFATGVGTAEMCAALITGEIWFKVPSAIKIVLNGKLKKGVSSKDIILRILGDIKADGGQYKSLEFTGSAVNEMSLDARFTISNMALEAGAKCALFEPDEKTAAYYGMELKDIDWVSFDDEAVYEKVLTYDVSTIEPLLSCPQGVDNVHSISEVKGTPIDEVYLGSCTNGSIEDLRIAAEIMKGKKVPCDMRFIVCPATNDIYKQAARLGYLETFVEAGGIVLHPCCGLCCGMPYGLMSDDDRLLSTSNRNFIGRQGTKKTLSYLCSPAVAAASALTGFITDPSKEE